MVAWLGVAQGVGSILGGLGGLFGGKKAKERSPYDTIMSQAAGARAASVQHGFNPLTLLQAGAGSGFTQIPGSAPPLASVQAITDGLAGLDDEFSGDAARRRQADQLEIDLAKVRLDEAKRGVGIGQPGHWDRALPAPSAPLTGNRAATVVQPSARVVPAKFGAGVNPVAPGRKDDIAPLVNSPGVFEVENQWTPFGPITIPGEGEPWGIDELGTAVGVGVPQIVAGGLQAMSDAVKDRFWDGKAALPYYREKAAKAAEADKREAGKPKPAERLYDGPGGPVYNFKY